MHANKKGGFVQEIFKNNATVVNISEEEKKEGCRFPLVKGPDRYLLQLKG